MALSVEPVPPQNDYSSVANLQVRKGSFSISHFSLDETLYLRFCF
jgi:hypothetical protein